MVETMSLSCMQQQPYYCQPLAPPGGCKGIGGHQQQQIIMKSLSPVHDTELGDLGGELDPSMYSDHLVADYDSTRIYNHLNHQQQTSVTDISYDVTSCYPGGHTLSNNSSATDCTTVTAHKKSLMGNHLTLESFDEKHPIQWSQAHLVQWFNRLCLQNDVEFQKLRLDQDSITGASLLHMTKAELNSRFPQIGQTVYDELQKFRQEPRFPEDNSTYPYSQSLEQQYWDSEEPQNVSNGYPFIHMLANYHHPTNQCQTQPSAALNNSTFDTLLLNGYQLPGSLGTPMLMEHEQQIKCEMDSDGESKDSYTNPHYSREAFAIPSGHPAVGNTPGRSGKRPGRPPNKDKQRNKGGQRNSRLWEFIRDLLLDSKTCPSLLKWENVDEGIFRFVQSDKVARLWGERKCNPRMTYEKLSRAMRYYYKSQVFQPVIGRRLVYKFGPNATGWRPSPALYS